MPLSLVDIICCFQLGLFKVGRTFLAFTKVHNSSPNIYDCDLKTSMLRNKGQKRHDFSPKVLFNVEGPMQDLRRERYTWNLSSRWIRPIAHIGSSEIECALWVEKRGGPLGGRESTTVLGATLKLWGPQSAEPSWSLGTQVSVSNFSFTEAVSVFIQCLSAPVVRGGQLTG